MAATGRELGLHRKGSSSLREETAKVTLNRVRNQGHPYVEIREHGKRFIFFCTLCLAPCYSDSVLFDHLKGSLHKQRYAAAKVTLFGPIPWPFNDGVFFFHIMPEKEQSAVSNSHRDKVLNVNVDDVGIVINDGYVETSKAQNDDSVGVNVSDSSGNLNPNSCNSALVLNDYDKILSPIEDTRQLVIPGVLVNDEVSVLAVRSIGLGLISSRIQETNDISNKVSRIWCAWLGEEDIGDRDLVVAPDCDFAIVTFSYTCDLGRKPILSDLSLPTFSPCLELENVGSDRKKRKESFSEPEDMHEARGDHCGSTRVDCPALNDSTVSVLNLQKGPADNALFGQYNHQLQHSRIISSKSVRRELRRQQRLAAERMCDICQQRMLPGKDVATLLNRKTGGLACSSRNTNGAFHVFHISCLIHWLLLCELEILTGPSTNAENTHGSTAVKSRRKRVAKSSKIQTSDGERESVRNHISSVFCPECQGTGINIEGDQLQKPTIPLAEMFVYKIKAIESHNAWMKNPEILQKCSTGLHFRSSSEENLQEKVLPLKLLHFYRAIG